MTINMDPKEVEHFLVCICFIVAVIGMCFIAWIWEKNK